jgi:hypothetical protein
MESKSRIYKVASGILQRCNNAKSTNYKYYGGRGVKCLLGKTNKEVYESLLKVEGYREGLQIDRIDNDGNYELGNLRWVDSLSNNNNKREQNEENILSKSFCRNNFKTLCKRRGWDFEDFEEVFEGETYLRKGTECARTFKKYKYKRR